ncbi:hypothetical protein GCM10009664_08060 [Kitasatospora gansuensis]
MSSGPAGRRLPEPYDPDGRLTERRDTDVLPERRIRPVRALRNPPTDLVLILDMPRSACVQVVD